jgi:nucleoside-diphosphate-sugar epimerase
MRVLVVGASGYIGGAIARVLAQAGHVVRALTRSDKGVAAAQRVGAEPVRGDLGDLAALRALAKEHDVAIHAASVTGPARDQLDRDASLALLEGARDGHGALIYTSGIWSLGATGDAIADEATPATRPAEVSRQRVHLERELLAGGAAVVRPGMVYGGHEGLAAWLGVWLPEESGHTDRVVVLGDGDYRWSPVHVEDVATLFRLVAEQRASGLFHAVEPDTVRAVDLANALARVSRRGEEALAWPLEEGRKKLGALADALVLDQRVAARRSAEVLGWRPSRAVMASVESMWRERAG